MAKKTNWSLLKDRGPQDTMRNRDVYEDQQLERSKIGKKRSPWIGITLMTIISLMITVVAWLAISGVQWGVSNTKSLAQNQKSMTEMGKLFNENVVSKYYHLREDSAKTDLLWIIDENGDREPDNSKGYHDKKEAYTAYADILRSRDGGLTDEQEKQIEQLYAQMEQNSFWYALGFSWWKFGLCAAIFLILSSILIAKARKMNTAVNVLEDTTDINQYPNDQHIALPEEVQRKFDWFPDVGAHSDVQFSSMISHMALTNKGLKTIKVAKRAKEDILDEDGDVEVYKGEVLTDDDGNIIYETKPMIDTEFMDALFEASGNPDDKKKGIVLNKKYDPNQIPYNPDGKDRDKLGKFDTVADLINEDWDFPYYEPQRPGGAYVVDTAPVNTMVLAIVSY